ncbi:PQQ-dependent sugar dehydrogenase [Cytophagales bacterium RKSG123]|nr:PQQ-dependent sugar dehydrogenase [Xanthovirga aplysinae]
MIKNTLLIGLLGFIFFQCVGKDNNGQVALLDENSQEAQKLYLQYCSSCHGSTVEAFADRVWKHGKSATDIFQSIKKGYPNDGMPAFEGSLSEEQIHGLVDYIQTAITNIERYGIEDEVIESDTFKTELLTFSLDTIASGVGVPWGIGFLPDNELLITNRSGRLYRIDANGNKIEIGGVPDVHSSGQGGLLDVVIHPNFEANNWVYFAYSGIKRENGRTLSATTVSRCRLIGDQLTESKLVFEALPYADSRIHYGSRMVFDDQGYLYITAGDRGDTYGNPQNLKRGGGKIHRIRDDGSIPEDNPFYHIANAMKSIYSYGHRNPQGLTLNPFTNELWSTEHGPRGGDEINIIKSGANYGWPVITYGINYNGTIITDKTEQEGMEQPLHYWTPSIAPTNLAFVNSDKYGDWKGSLLVGSLRYRYLNRSVLVDNQVVGEELLVKNIGRLREVKMGPDGYIYIGVETGYVFRLMPIDGSDS